MIFYMTKSWEFLISVSSFPKKKWEIMKNRNNLKKKKRKCSKEKLKPVLFSLCLYRDKTSLFVPTIMSTTCSPINSDKMQKCQKIKCRLLKLTHLTNVLWKKCSCIVIFQKRSLQKAYFTKIMRMHSAAMQVIKRICLWVQFTINFS